MTRIVAVNERADILPGYVGTSVEVLLAFHNLELEPASQPERDLLIGMCMDSRKAIRMPSDFAFVLRTAGANMRDNEFRISYAIAVGGVRTIVLVAHTDCGMKRVASQRDQFVQGLMEHAGWDEARAERMFAEGVPKFGITDEVGFVMGEADRLRGLYPKLAVVPLLYRVEDDRLYQLE